ncbi:MAG: nitroreductase family protein [Anaerolineales bacterium]
MELYEAIMGRRSIRKYTDKPIEDGILEQMLDAARWAPNGGNNNAWRFVVVTSQIQKKLVLNFCPGIFDVPAAIIVICAEPKQKCIKEATRLLYMADCAIAAENIVLAAYSLGIGSCIVASFADVALRDLIELPESIKPYIIVTLGYPAEDPEPPPRLPIRDIVYKNEYGKEWARDG